MTSILKPLASGKFWKELLIMTLGMSFGAAAVYYFLMPSKLIIGSISGLSIVLSEVFAGFGIAIKTSTIIVIINALLLVLAWLLIGAEFGLKTVYTALILGPLIDFWEFVLPYEKLLGGGTSVMNDPWLDLICFVLMLSISQAILFHINASTGGLDILAKIVNKYLHFDIGASVSVAGAVICCTAFARSPIVDASAFCMKSEVAAFILSREASPSKTRWNWLRSSPRMNMPGFSTILRLRTSNASSPWAT